MKITWIFILLVPFFKNIISKKIEKTNNQNSWKNLNINRVIDLSKSYVKETTTIIIQNIGDSPLDEYFWVISNNITDKISYIEVKEENEQILLLDLIPLKKSPFNDIKLYTIKLSKPVLPNNFITIEINMAIVNILKPLPPVFSQSQNQYLIWEGFKYSLSFYSTDKQKTHIKIDNKDILSHSQYNENNSINPIWSKPYLIYSFHNIVKPFSKDVIFVHYKYNEPITVIKQLEREIEVSHWGNNIAVKNTYSITNAGVKLKEKFSRIKWNQQLYYNTFHAVISSLKINLKAGTRDTYHVDEIGIVSTSEFVSNPKNTHIIIKPRYPVFGGWNYSCTVGWNLDLNRFLKKKNSRIYILKIPFIEGPMNAYYENVSVNIILPEGSRILNVISRIPISESRTSIHKTYMDVVGRTSIKLFSKNIIDTVSSEYIFILYDYPIFENFRKPLTVSITISLLFLISSFLKKFQINF
ncbi:hypothetical protein PORY_002382 [Pneumocystis oryctolagi]|uniref:Uncharacterized protein n=1 Tax=Pneumocystis oryctolagi TaxID=42067 RepID=A0ACB7C943_9ASCO|nr:hypothetical protein PORY_002382 [Pneumocystis oryctolagi]